LSKREGSKALNPGERTTEPTFSVEETGFWSKSTAPTGQIFLQAPHLPFWMKIHASPSMAYLRGTAWAYST
jgi:hypothetical protein